MSYDFASGGLAATCKVGLRFVSRRRQELQSSSRFALWEKKVQIGAINLSEKINDSVKLMFDVELHREINIV